MFEKGPTTGVLRCYLLVVVVVVADLVIVVERYLCLRCVLYTRKIIFTVVSPDKAESVEQRNSTHMPFVCVVFWRVHLALPGGLFLCLVEICRSAIKMMSSL